MGALAANRSIIPVFRDSSCQSLLASASTDKVMADGDCLALPNGANSVETKQVAPGCQVTVYSNPNCLGNETIAEVGDCMDMGITSYSVDCPYLNSSSSDFISSSSDTLLLPSSSLSSNSALSTIKFTSSDLTPLTAPSTSDRSSSSKDLGSDQTSTTPTFISSSSSVLSLSSLSAQSSTSSNPHNNSGGGNNLSKADEIAIGVVLPSVAIIVAVVIGILQRKRKSVA